MTHSHGRRVEKSGRISSLLTLRKRMYLVSTEALNLYTHTLMEELLPDLDSYLGLACWIAKSWTPVIACWVRSLEPVVVSRI